MVMIGGLEPLSSGSIPDIPITLYTINTIYDSYE